MLLNYCHSNSENKLRRKMNSPEEKINCKRAAVEIDVITLRHLAALEELLTLKKENGFSEKCNCSTQFNETALDLVFDAIHHSVKYSNNPSEMESFRDELIGAVDKLSCLINVWKESEKRKNTVHHSGSPQS